MHKLGLTLELMLMATLVTMGCTRTANTGSLPPPGSDSSTSTAQALPSPVPPTPANPTSSASSVPAGEKTYDDSTTSITTKLGERFTLTLPANITTPYKWIVASPETNVALAERHYQERPPEGCKGCMGSPGVDRLTFEAKQAGETKLLLRYAPLHSNEPAERELTIAVTVNKP